MYDIFIKESPEKMRLAAIQVDSSESESSSLPFLLTYSVAPSSKSRSS